MSILDKFFGKKPAPYELNPSDPDYDYYAGLRASAETAQEMLNAMNNTGAMPPLVVPNAKDAHPAPKVADNVANKFSEPPVDAEDASYATWAQDKAKDAPTEKPIASGKPNIPEQPKIPNRPEITPLTPAKDGRPKGGTYGGKFGYKDDEPGSEFVRKPFYWQPVAPKIPEKDVLACVVENSSDTLKQRESIINIISQTLEKKKDAIFIFVKVGNGQTPFAPMDYDTVKKKDVFSSLITESEKNELPNLASALFYLVNNLNVFAADTFTFAKTKYKLGNCSIVCIGTGACVQNDDTLKIVSSCISNLQNISKLKAFKYFCIKDSDAIRVSALGFPVIGHILSDFYE